LTFYVFGYYLLTCLRWLLQLYAWVFIADALLSWFLLPDNKLRRVLIFLTEPIVSLFRPLSERIMRNARIPISLAHLFAYVFIQLLYYGVSRLILFLY
jgi:uncharacterized protein YggT (Ycf19 family)